MYNRPPFFGMKVIEPMGEVAVSPALLKFVRQVQSGQKMREWEHGNSERLELEMLRASDELAKLYSREARKALAVRSGE